jgi:hypothetical protein
MNGSELDCNETAESAEACGCLFQQTVLFMQWREGLQIEATLTIARSSVTARERIQHRVAG